jgi:class 3 adenylate cyclase
LFQAIARLNEQLSGNIVTPVVAPVTASGIREGAASHGGERRKLTLMFCDLAGSTALSEKLDPEELRNLMHAHRVLCDRALRRVSRPIRW